MGLVNEIADDPVARAQELAQELRAARTRSRSLR